LKGYLYGTASIGDGQRIQLIDLHESSARLLPLDTRPGYGKYLPSEKVIAIACKDNSELHVTTIQPPGKKPLAAKEWWNGVRKNYLIDGLLCFGGGLV